MPMVFEEKVGFQLGYEYSNSFFREGCILKFWSIVNEILHTCFKEKDIFCDILPNFFQKHRAKLLIRGAFED